MSRRRRDNSHTLGSPLGRSLLALALVTPALALAPRPVAAQCGPPNCVPSTMGGMSCSVAWMNPSPGCTGFGGYVVNAGMCTNAVNQGATGDVGMARHYPGSSPTATCSWSFQSFAATVTPIGFGGVPVCSKTNTSVCTITTADGLPVELMEFSVESDADTESDTEEPVPEETDRGAEA